MDISHLGKQLLKFGVQHQASDIYIFPIKKGYDVSFRYHQGKVSYAKLTVEEGEKLILFFKYMADMDVAEKRRIQVGAGSKIILGRKRRLRFSTVGDFQHRESLVIRLLHDFTGKQDYLVLFPTQLPVIEEAVKRSGLYLFSGPTGSGKTTSMYRLAKQLGSQSRQVITIEDPVEIEDSAFLQLQVNRKINLSYEKLVKVCLRHRPDVLIVGEIRDRETAQAVIRGALTGHTIFSTIHGLNKESIIPRLLELGVAKGELTQCLRGIIYQRLLPIVCPYCLGACSQFCQSGGSGVMFDVVFTENGELPKKTSKSWQKKLQKAWVLGYITAETYQKEC